MVKKGYPLINRELSWLSFNERVLQEAGDPTVPLIERVRFLAIFSSNLDEFFRVRFARMYDQPDQLLNKVKQKVIRLQQQFDKIYEEVIIPSLAEERVFLINEQQLNVERGAFVKNYFNTKVLPAFVPLMLDSLDKFPELKDGSIYFIVKLSRKDGRIPPRKALIELPTALFPRFLVLPQTARLKYIIFLDDVLRYCLDNTFSIFGYNQYDAYAIKLTRDSELDMDLSGSMLSKVSKGLKRRKAGRPVRFVYDRHIEPELLSYLMKKIKLKRKDLIPGSKYLDFKDFFRFPGLGVDRLEYPKMPPMQLPGFRLNQSLFRLIRRKSILLSFPYHSYDYVIHFLREAAIDPGVTAIRITLYRLAQDSMIINALINAAKNGKKVFVLIEPLARFDEEANIYWTGKLEEEGVTVRYGFPDLKVHSKICLVSRREPNGKNRDFAYLATGNFNEKTALIYADYGYFTADKRIASEVKKAFGELEKGKIQENYGYLLAAPLGMRHRLNQLIDAEIRNAKRGKPAAITIKVNSLSDEKMIRKLYEASNSGVKIRLIVRGICCLVPGQKGYSENIKVISIVDRFLEHARVYIFAGGGRERIYLSSADLMTRNLDHRFEIAFPVINKEHKKQLRDMIELQWKDNTKARTIGKRQLNRYRKNTGKENYRAQRDTYNYLRK